MYIESIHRCLFLFESKKQSIVVPLLFCNATVRIFTKSLIWLGSSKFQLYFKWKTFLFWFLFHFSCEYSMFFVYHIVIFNYNCFWQIHKFWNCRDRIGWQNGLKAAPLWKLFLYWQFLFAQKQIAFFRCNRIDMPFVCVPILQMTNS